MLVHEEMHEELVDAVPGAALGVCRVGVAIDRDLECVAVFHEWYIAWIRFNMATAPCRVASSGSGNPTYPEDHMFLRRGQDTSRIFR